VRNCTRINSPQLSTKTFLLVVLWLGGICSLAQEQRPKIGVVLSGGGAKGIAHIGVLKAMEEAGLTPDYITGTSMGSIVGGLYAAGYSADELKEIVEGIDWGLLLSNKIPFDEVTFE
jgi:NTE family protein